MNIRTPNLPPALLRKLKAQRLQYTEIKTVFHAIQLDADYWIGVVGDGDNGGYETFVSDGTRFEVSDVAWGDTTRALQHIINQEVKP